MYGSQNNPGLTPRAASELFMLINRDVNKYSFSLKVRVICFHVYFTHVGECHVINCHKKFNVQAYLVELYQDKFVDLLLPKDSKPQKLEVKKDSKVQELFHLHSFHFPYSTFIVKCFTASLYIWFPIPMLPSFSCLLTLDV
jgi:hypothetical protein